MFGMAQAVTGLYKVGMPASLTPATDNRNLPSSKRVDVAQKYPNFGAAICQTSRQFQRYRARRQDKKMNFAPLNPVFCFECKIQCGRAAASVLISLRRDGPLAERARGTPKLGALGGLAVQRSATPVCANAPSNLDGGHTPKCPLVSPFEDFDVFSN
jgi:hypothetical protein